MYIKVHTQSLGPALPTSTIKCCLEMVLSAIANCPTKRFISKAIKQIPENHTIRPGSPKDKLLPRTKPKLLAYHRRQCALTLSISRKSYLAMSLLRPQGSTYLRSVLEVGYPEISGLRTHLMWMFGERERERRCWPRSPEARYHVCSS